MMTTQIDIRNYKSIIETKMDLGNFNLLIGANGCGKSNILEAIAMGAAASADKLDFEFFANRGIRAVEPEFMLPAFEGIRADAIRIGVKSEDTDMCYFDVRYDKNARPSRWVDDSVSVGALLAKLKTGPINGMTGETLQLKSTLEELISVKPSLSPRLKLHDSSLQVMSVNSAFNKYLIYSLEESKLRQADNTNRTYPLGRHGEGLFAYLKDLSQRTEGLAIINEIKENLTILDWFDDMIIPQDQLSNEFNIRLRDNYLTETLNSFDQRSTNEGFLYLLFYLVLIVSDETPQFCAIDNIDAAFNPKLCREATKRMIALAKKHNKQILATTHNAAVLDGLDLTDDCQMLYVVRRSVDGYTKANRVKLKEQLSMPLSEAWAKGYIGGLPDNF